MDTSTEVITRDMKMKPKTEPKNMANTRLMNILKGNPTKNMQQAEADTQSTPTR